MSIKSRKKTFLISIATIILFLSFLLILEYVRSIKRPGIISSGAKCDIIKNFSFSNKDALREWEEKIFKNKVNYSIRNEAGSGYVKAASDNAASALYYKINMDVKSSRPVISWKWKVDKFPVKKVAESLELENEDDFAARVYVIFPAMFITNSKVVEYVWSETIPEGTVGTSPYSKNIKLIALRKGPSADNKWHTEERDIVADYEKLFGSAPDKNIGAIAFMTNTEHTGSAAEADYGDIVVGYRNGRDK